MTDSVKDVSNLEAFHAIWRIRHILSKWPPRIPVAVLLWEEDGDFPDESKILFDRSIAEHLALDIIFGLTVEICTRVAGLPIYPL